MEYEIQDDDIGLMSHDLVEENKKEASPINTVNIGNDYTQFTLLSSVLNLNNPNELFGLRPSNIVEKAFKTLDEAHDFYTKYFTLIGFGVR